MIEFNVFPGGKRRIVTFSYDDGHFNDKRLMEMFDKYGVKATFHLNGEKYLDKTDNELEKIRELYKNHEISCHTVHHGRPEFIPSASFAAEVLEDRKILERIAGYPVLGMSYPNGTYSADTLNVLKACGIIYSRTTKSTGNFTMPQDFIEWHPTCHHRDALALCDKFLEDIDSPWTHPLFYIWGHSHELMTEESWEYIEKVISKLAFNPKIWYASNIEIVRYAAAQNRLEISADETMFFNPSAIDVWVVKNKETILKIPAGERIAVG